MFTQLLAYNDVGLFLLRAAVAIVFFVHSWPKLSKSKIMASGMGVSSAIVLLLGAIEFVSALGLVLGIYTQLAALLLALVMIGAIKMKYMKWSVAFNAMDKTGWEFDFVLLFACVSILLGGGGPIGL